MINKSVLDIGILEFETTGGCQLKEFSEFSQMTNLKEHQ